MRRKPRRWAEARAVCSLGWFTRLGQHIDDGVPTLPSPENSVIQGRATSVAVSKKSSQPSPDGFLLRSVSVNDSTGRWQFPELAYHVHWQEIATDHPTENGDFRIRTKCITSKTSDWPGGMLVFLVHCLCGPRASTLLDNRSPNPNSLWSVRTYDLAPRLSLSTAPVSYLAVSYL